MRIDLTSGASRSLLARGNESESLDLPAMWADGSGIVYQRSNPRGGVSVAGQPYVQYPSRVEQVPPDGSAPVLLLDDARYPGPAPDGTHIAFVRSVEHGAAIFVHSVADGTDAQLVAPGNSLALAYPRFSPSGQQVAFGGISLLAPLGHTPDNRLTQWLSVGRLTRTAFPGKPGC